MDFQVALKSDTFALAQVASVSDERVIIDINPQDHWDAASLLKLAAMLKGVAAVLATTALLFASSFGSEVASRVVDTATDSAFAADYPDY